MSYISLQRSAFFFLTLLLPPSNRNYPFTSKASSLSLSRPSFPCAHSPKLQPEAPIFLCLRTFWPILVQLSPTSHHLFIDRPRLEKRALDNRLPVPHFQALDGPAQSGDSFTYGCSDSER
ncbi:hypothetical protein RRG08_034698 [Elysia crispata]|uniref:Uncharacterized protein n=1 Tax=Elysia crispata TaxID=231223 RepID=A0AAE0Z2V1_9GAST|nr:hypothetical protein RRG08_034698 [Elysia crispata]